jgi:hypothetical protein
MGRRGRQLMSDRYDYPAMLRTLADTFEEVTAAKGRINRSGA